MTAPLSGADVDRVRQAVTEVAAARGPDQVLPHVVRAAARLCGTPLAAMTMRPTDSDHLALVSVFGTGGVIRERLLPIARSLNGDVITSGRSFRSADVWRDARRPVSDIARRNRVRSLLIAPLVARGAAAGTIAVARRAPGQFTARHEALLEEFARNLSTPLEHVWTCTAPWRLSAPTHGDHDGPDLLRPLGARPSAASAFADQPVPAGRHRLSTREREVLGLLLADHTYQQIASALGLSPRTVEHYVARLKLRFGKATLHGLATFVLGSRLLE